jgi:hypothetical protein
MTDPLDVDLQDCELTAEIALVTDLMVAASESEQHLSQACIDDILAQTAPALPCQRRPLAGG